MLLVSNTLALTLQGTPKMLDTMQTKFKPWSGSAQNVPDGKMWMLPKDPSDASAGWIINVTPNNFISSTTPYVTDVTTPYNDPSEQSATSNGNMITVPATIPIPSASETGMRGNGSLYDELSDWIFNVFRLSETSDPSAPSTHLIGFEHNEDYWKVDGGGGDCTYKSIAVRYSEDLGKSWTRSVPIVTKGIQTATCDDANQFTGTGDFVTIWNSAKKEWVIYAQEGSIVMSHSSDPMAKPGSWTRLDPVSGKTQPGFIGSTDGTTLTHGDFASLGGGNPSCLFDKKTNMYHMVWSKWGGGIAYANSADLYRWSTPVLVWEDSSAGGIAPGSTYPTLVGDQGDTLSTNGVGVLYFGASNKVDWGRPLWSVDVTFDGSTAAAQQASTSAASEIASATTFSTAYTTPTATGGIVLIASGSFKPGTPPHSSVAGSAAEAKAGVNEKHKVKHPHQSHKPTVSNTEDENEQDECDAS